jgi:hypothetical protein
LNYNRKITKVERSPISRFGTSVLKVDFAEQLLHEFNLARTNPMAYANKIQKFLKYIKVIDNQHLFMYETDYEKYPKINLLTGEKAFLHFIEFLECIDELPPLVLNDEIVIKVPNAVQDMNSYEKISSLIATTKKNLKGYYKGLRFHYDVCFNNPEISAMLQMIDDTNIGQQRRKNIFSRDIEFMGVSVAKIQSKRIIVYITFARTKV